MTLEEQAVVKALTGQRNENADAVVGYFAKLQVALARVAELEKEVEDLKAKKKK